MMPDLNILHADSHTLTRMGLQSVLQHGGCPLKVTGVDHNSKLNDSIKKLKPRILIIDYNNTGHFSIEDIHFVKKQYPETKILVITDDQDRARILKVVEAGIHGFLSHNSDNDEIIKAVMMLFQGEEYYSHDVLNIIHNKSVSSQVVKCIYAVLTEREIEISRLIATGMTSKEIATKLFISLHTVQSHRKNIMKKLGVSTASELTLYAVNVGLV